MIKDKLLYIIITPLLIFISIFLSSPTASATSDYDDALQSTDSLVLFNESYMVDNAQFVYTQVIDAIGDSKKMDSFTDSSGLTIYPSDSLDSQDEIDRMRSLWNDKKRWAVVQHCFFDNSFCGISILATTDDSLSLIWSKASDGSPVVLATGSKGSTFTLFFSDWSSGTNRLPFSFNDTTWGWSIPVSGLYSSFNNSYYSLNTSLPNYPDGYSGSEIVNRPLVEESVSDVDGWNDDCGLDIGCHLGNIGSVLKPIGSFITGIFDFSENNSLLKILKWLFIPEDPSSLFDLTDQRDGFKDSLQPVFSSIEFLKTLFNSLFPISGWTYSNYCSNSLVGDAGGTEDSSGHLYILPNTVDIFGASFDPDLCTYERVVGGWRITAQFRVFASTGLFLVCLFMWYKFFEDLSNMRL